MEASVGGEKMTLLELQNVLGEQISAMVNGTADVEHARAIAGIAKQMINNADVVMRADKYTKADGKRINSVVGELNGG